MRKERGRQMWTIRQIKACSQGVSGVAGKSYAFGGHLVAFQACWLKGGGPRLSAQDVLQARRAEVRGFA